MSIHSQDWVLFQHFFVVWLVIDLAKRGGLASSSIRQVRGEYCGTLYVINAL
jgi:hypothetical protein